MTDTHVIKGLDQKMCIATANFTKSLVNLPSIADCQVVRLNFWRSYLPPLQFKMGRGVIVMKLSLQSIVQMLLW